MLSLWSVARTRSVSVAALVFGGFAICNGVAGLGPQMLVYSVVFGAPLALAFAIPRRGSHIWRRDHRAVVAVAGAAVLLMLPRLASMLHYQLGDDVGRGLGHALVHSYGNSAVHDWLVSVPWTQDLVAHWPGTIPALETNYPIGPLVLLAALARPAITSSRQVGALTMSAGLAILFALDVTPISQLFLGLPTLESYRRSRSRACGPARRQHLHALRGQPSHLARSRSHSRAGFRRQSASRSRGPCASRSVRPRAGGRGVTCSLPSR
jgi:hypothetical protein